MFIICAVFCCSSRYLLCVQLQASFSCNVRVLPMPFFCAFNFIFARVFRFCCRCARFCFYCCVEISTSPECANSHCTLFRLLWLLGMYSVIIWLSGCDWFFFFIQYTLSVIRWRVYCVCWFVSYYVLRVQVFDYNSLILRCQLDVRRLQDNGNIIITNKQNSNNERRKSKATSNIHAFVTHIYTLAGNGQHKPNIENAENRMRKSRWITAEKHANRQHGESRWMGEKGSGAVERRWRGIKRRQTKRYTAVAARLQ